MGWSTRWRWVLLTAVVVAVVAILWPHPHRPAAERTPAGAGRSVLVPPRLAEKSNVPSWLGGEVQTRSVAGRVTAGGAPVAGARVRLASRASALAGAPVEERVTGPDGRFDFGGQRVNAYTLAASAPEKTEAALAFHLEDPRVGADRLELVLGGCQTVIEGTIVDADGRPVEKARVRRLDAASIPVETDGNGKFRRCIAAGETELAASADGFGPSFFAVKPPAPAQVTLAAPGHVAGVCVSDEDGEPVSGAVVAVGRFPEIVWGLSDASGRFDVPVGAGSGEVHAFSVDRQSRDETFSALEPGGVTRSIVLRLRPALRLVGQVVAAGQRAAGVPISSGKADEAYGSFPVYSKADGSFVLPRLRQGMVALESEGYLLIAPKMVWTSDEPSPPITVEIAALVNLRGRVLRDGAPVADAEVSCKGAKETWTAVRSGPAGAYLCEKLAAGHHVISAEDALGAFSDDIDVELKPGEDRKLDIELAHSASISGILVDEAGQPVAGATVHFAAGDDDGDAKTGDDGRFRVEALAGRAVYRATVWPPNTRAFTMDAARSFPVVDVPGPRSQVSGIRLEVVRKAPSITGVAFDETDTPAPGVVLALRDRPDGAPLAEVVSGSDGAFAFQPPERAIYEIYARAPDGADRELRNIPSGATDLHVKLDAPIGIDGTIAGFHSEVDVTVVNAGRTYTLPQVRKAFRLHGLKLGPCIVAARDADRDGQAVAVNLTERTPVPVTLTAQKAARISLDVVDATTRGPATATCRWSWRLGETEAFDWRETPYAQEGRRELIVPPADVFIMCDRTKVALTLAPGEVRSVELAVDSDSAAVP